MTSAAARVRDEARRYLSDPLARVIWRGRLLHPVRRWAFAEFGPHSILHRPDWVMRPDKIAIGARVLVFHGMWLAVETPAWNSPGPAIRIGDDVGIRPYCTISAASSIVLEDNVIVGAYSSIIDSDHTFEAGRPNVMHNPLVTEPVHVGAGTWIAERCSVLRGSRIGCCCIIGANSVVRGDIPDYSIAVGAPARVVGSTQEHFQEGAA
jgi:acetyltransferase-like isoleucine patch superfamily enzyme